MNNGEDIMSNEPLLDELEGIILQNTPNAVKLLLFDGDKKWFPKSCIVNMDEKKMIDYEVDLESIDLIEPYNNEDSQTFLIDQWLLKKKGIDVF